jgi:hypothetical protein
MEATSKWHFVPRLPNGNLDIPKIGIPVTCLKQSCSFCRELSNNMLHATYMQGNRVNSRLLEIGSQIAKLIPDLSFDHNLCFRCPNESCKTHFKYLRFNNYLMI